VGARRLAAIVVASFALLAPAGAQAISYRAPVFGRAFPDPSVIHARGSYWAYSTQVSWERPGHVFPILRSKDLVHWRPVGDVFDRTPSWGSGSFWWSPSAIAYRGRYYVFYSAWSTAERRHCVAVATARTPAGPFHDHGPLSCGDSTVSNYIDPDPFVDTDGRAYLYVSAGFPAPQISVIPLSSNLLSFAGPRAPLFGVSQSWEHGPGGYATVEGPFMVKAGAGYYLFYSGNAWWDNYALGYATSRSPIGPFTKSDRNPILRGDALVQGPGGGSVVNGPGGHLWLAYHGWRPGQAGKPGAPRLLRVAPIAWSVNGPRIASR
jgi:beta-xylosidase